MLASIPRIFETLKPNDKAARDAAEAELDAMIEAICEDGPLSVKSVVDAFFEGSRSHGNWLG